MSLVVCDNARVNGALQCLGDSVVTGTKQIKCQPFKRWLGSRGSGRVNSFGKQSTAILFSPSAAVSTFLMLMDILKDSRGVAHRSGVTLLVEIYNILDVRGISRRNGKQNSVTGQVTESWISPDEHSLRNYTLKKVSFRNYCVNSFNNYLNMKVDHWSSFLVHSVNVCNLDSTTRLRPVLTFAQTFDAR